MTVTGTTVVHYAARQKMRYDAHYDRDLALAAITLEGDLSATGYLNVEQLARYISRLNYVLEQALEAEAIGFEAYKRMIDHEIVKLERDVQTQPAPKRGREKPLPPCGLTPDQIREAAIAEVEKVKAARARGEYK